MAKKDCPYCSGSEKYFIAGTNIEVHCEYCVKGVIPKSENYDPAKIEPGLVSKITNFFNGNNET